MVVKSMKVKTLAEKYGLAPKEIIKELESQGFTGVKTASSNIPADAVELVEAYFDELMAKRNKSDEAELVAEEVEEKLSEKREPVKTRKRSSGSGNYSTREEGVGGGGGRQKSKQGKLGKSSSGVSVAPSSPAVPAQAKEVHIKTPIIVKNLAEALGKKPNEVITGLLMMNVLASINQVVEPEVAQKLAESMNFTPGASVRLFSYKGWKIMPGICFDMRFPIWSRNVPDDPYDLYLNVANWPASRRSAADILLKARAIENVSYAAICTRSGSDPLMAYDGQSSVVNHRGRVRSHTCDIQGTPVCFAVLDKSELVRYRQAFPALNQRD